MLNNTEVQNIPSDGMLEDGWFEDSDALVSRRIPSAPPERRSKGEIDGFVYGLCFKSLFNVGTQRATYTANAPCCWTNGLRFTFKRGFFALVRTLLAREGIRET